MAKSKSDVANNKPSSEKYVDYFSEEQNIEFSKILMELSSNQLVLKENFNDIVNRLEQIYCPLDGKRFHHYYSVIYSTLTQIRLKDLNLDILAQNLEFLKDNYKKNRSDISTELNKLFDHTNLEISRLNYSLTVKQESESKLSQLKPELEESKRTYNELKKQLNKAKDQLKELEDKNIKLESELKNSKIDYVAVLGIFASIVLAFVGSLTFTSSVFQNINAISVYRLIAITSFIGVTFFDIIWLLTEFISKITNRELKISKLVPIIFNLIVFLILIGDTSFYIYNLYKNRQKVDLQPIQEVIIIEKQLPAETVVSADDIPLESSESKSSDKR